MSIEVKDDKVSLNIAGNYSADQLTELIAQLGAARAQIAEDPMQPEEGVNYPGVMEPRLWTQWGPHTSGHFVLMTRHPGFGWNAAVMTARTASEIAVFLNQYLVYHVAATAAANTPSATDPALGKGQPQGGSGGNTLH